MYQDSYFYKAVEAKLNGEIEGLRAELIPFFENPVGVADHSNFIDIFKDKLEKLDDCEGQLEMLKKHYGS